MRTSLGSESDGISVCYYGSPGLAGQLVQLRWRVVSSVTNPVSKTKMERLEQRADPWEMGTLGKTQTRLRSLNFSSVSKKMIMQLKTLIHQRDWRVGFCGGWRKPYLTIYLAWSASDTRPCNYTSFIFFYLVSLSPYIKGWVGGSSVVGHMLRTWRTVGLNPHTTTWK